MPRNIRRFAKPPVDIIRNAIGYGAIPGTGATAPAARYVAQNAIRPASWTFTSPFGDSNSQILADTGPASTTWPNSRLFRTSNNGEIRVVFTEPLSVGEVIIIQVAWRCQRNADGTVATGRGGDNASIRLKFNAGTNVEGWYTNDITSANPTYINDINFNQTGIWTKFIGSTGIDAQGFTTLTYSHTVQNTDLQIWLRPNQNNLNATLSIGGVQIIRNATSGMPWHDVVTTTLVDAATGVDYVPPKTWSYWFPDPVTSGLNTEIVKTGFEGGQPRLDWRFYGTPSISADAIIVFVPNVSYIHRRQGENYGFSCLVRLVAGVLPADLRIIVHELDFASVDLGSTSSPIRPTNAPIAKQRFFVVGRLQQAAVGKVVPGIQVVFTAGVAIDFTLGLSLPQFTRSTRVMYPERRFGI